jgi:hypothetical protein
MERIELTYKEKLAAISAKHYQYLKWTPKKGDYYTTVRNDLELYQIVDEDELFLYTKYCNPEKGSEISKWEKDKFLTDFGIHRVYVPDWIFE